MASGGTFLTYNKILPGAYINFVSKARALGGLSDRGVVTMAMKINWGEENKIINVTADDFETNALQIFGYSYSSDELKPIREVFKNANELKLFRLGSGEKAKVTLGGLTATAIYGGARGNDIKIKVSQNLDNEKSTIFTYIDESLVDEQEVATIQELEANRFVTFSGSGEFISSAGTNLTGGTDSVTNNEEYSKFLSLVEAESFNTLLYDGNDDVTKGLFTSFTKRLRDEEGVKFVTILHNYAKADYEGIVSLKNDINLIYWVAGALAGAEVNESITNKTYDGEYDFDAKFSNSELKDFINSGEFVFYYDAGDKKILKDINTFTSFTTDKNSDFSNNQIIRVLDATANDIARIFNDYYLGKIQNDELGRDLFKAEVIAYFQELQSIRAIDSFEESDISVSKGTEKGDVIVNALIEPVACMDKLYMKCIIE